MSQYNASKQLEVTVKAIDNEDRIDFQYYAPKYFEVVKQLEAIRDTLKLDLIPLKQLLYDKKKGITGGATPLGASYLSEGIPFIRVQNVRRTGVKLSNVVFIAKQLHDTELRRSQLMPKDVLLTITGAYGIAAVVPDNLDYGNINQHVVRIRVNQHEINPDFLALYLNSRFGRTQTDRNVTGSSRLALDYSCIKELLVLRPKLQKQEEIVKAVKAILNEANSIQKQIKEIEKRYDIIVLDKLGIKLPSEPNTKVFLAQTDEEDRLEVKWYYPFYDEIVKLITSHNSRKIADYTHKLTYGASIDADYVSDVPFLRIENLRRNFIDVSDLQFIPNSVYRNEITGLYLHEGDILIERSGTYVGLCSYVPQNMNTFVYGSYIIRLRLNDSRILPEYLSVFINSILGRLQFDRLKTGALQFNINTQHIRNLWLIEPEKSIQQEIATEVFCLIEKAKYLKLQYNEKLIQAEALFENVLERN